MDTEPSSESPVSWQSAFWGLIGIQIAVLTQNTGAVLGLRYDMRIGLRSSPVFCALDTAMALFKFILLLLQGHSWKAAAQHVWWDRYTDEDGNVTSKDDWAFNMRTFIACAVPQAVKIYSMTGVPITQVLATIYLISFISMEFFRLAAGPEKPTNRQERLRALATNVRKSWVKRSTTFLAIFGNVAQFWISLVIFAAILPENKLWYPSNNLTSIIQIVCYWISHYTMLIGLSVAWCVVFKRGTGIMKLLAVNSRDDVEQGFAKREDESPVPIVSIEGTAAASSVTNPPQAMIEDRGRMTENNLATAANIQDPVANIVPSQRPNANKSSHNIHTIFGIEFENPFDVYIIPAMICHGLMYPTILILNEDNGGPLAFSFREIIGPMFMVGVIVVPGVLYIVVKQFIHLSLVKGMVLIIGIPGQAAWTEYYGFFMYVLWIAAFFVSYSSTFDSEGTSRPSWTEYLG